MPIRSLSRGAIVRRPRKPDEDVPPAETIRLFAIFLSLCTRNADQGFRDSGAAGRYRPSVVADKEMHETRGLFYI